MAEGRGIRSRREDVGTTVAVEEKNVAAPKKSLYVKAQS
jgi:hypothetical protein